MKRLVIVALIKRYMKGVPFSVEGTHIRGLTGYKSGLLVENFVEWGGGGGGGV